MLMVKLICFFFRTDRRFALSLSAMVFSVPINRFCNPGGNSRLPVSSLHQLLYHKKINNSNKICKCIIFVCKCMQMHASACKCITCNANAYKCINPILYVSRVYMRMYVCVFQSILKYIILLSGISL